MPENDLQDAYEKHMESHEKTGENKPERDEKGRLLPGNTANPNGRPKGSLSIKDLVRQHLQDNPEELKSFVQHFIEKNRELAWQMLEGRPAQATDLTTNGESVTPLLVKFIDGPTESNRDTTGV